MKTSLKIVISLIFFGILTVCIPEESLSFTSDNAVQNDTIPEPRTVMLRSLMVPGWGQITNQQAWKVPIVYGVIGGMIYAAIVFDNQYQGYRAAYYNSFADNTDMRFGPTPDFVNPDFSQEGLRQQRNSFRNQRDLTFVLVGVAYALNAIDAYVFAHMRDFDVSDDLSARISPVVVPGPDDAFRAGLSVSFNF